MPDRLVKRIFDIENDEVGLDIKERAELAFAFLTNSEAIERTVSNAGLKLSEWQDEWDGMTRYDAGKFLEDLWLFASKWPVETKVPATVYKFIRAEDKVKASVYQACSDRFLRQFILESCNGSEAETLELGMKDSNDDCRRTAFEKVGSLEPKQIKEIFQGQDEHALRGLISNRSLFVASVVVLRALRSKGWYSVSSDHLKQLGGGDWYKLIGTYQVVVILGGGLLAQLRKMIFDRTDYLWEKRFPTDIFTVLRRKLGERLGEFDKTDKNHDWQFRTDRKALENTLPPSDPIELFDPLSSNESDFVKAKLDFIGWKLLRLESRERFFKKLILIAFFVWLGSKLYGLFS